MNALTREFRRRQRNLQKNYSRLRPCGRARCPNSALKPCWLSRKDDLHEGLKLAGYLRSQSGLGRSARLLIQAARTAAIQVSTRNLLLPGRQSQDELYEEFDQCLPMRAELLVKDMYRIDIHALATCRKSHNILYPFWELSNIHPDDARHLRHFDTHWAPSRFIFDLIANAQPRPVHYVPQPVELPEECRAKPLPGNRLKCITFFDFSSFFVRKNPVGGIKAFQAAFPKKSEDVSLVVKMHGKPREEEWQLLQEAISEDARIELVNRVLTRGEMQELIDDCDVYLSLHRAEGFGFGPAEALASGKAVISTDYSGTTDFLNNETGFPVSFDMIPVARNEYIGDRRGLWADPSIEHAAEHLKSLYDNPDQILEKARAGHALLTANHSAEAVGRRMRRLLEADGII